MLAIGSIMNTVRAVLLVVRVVLVAAAVLLVAALWYEHTGTPQYSLAQLAEAVKAKDYETARYFVDDERIADTASKSFLDAAMSRATEEITADGNPFSGFGVAAIQMMAPRIRETAKDQIKDSIRQALSGNDTLTNTKVAQQWGSNRFSNLQIGECVVSGNTAEVVIRGIPQPNPARITEVHLRMARIPDTRNWRIEEIPEVGQAFVKLLDVDALQRASAEASADPPNASVPAVRVSKPNRVLELTTSSVCGVDFRNTSIFDEGRGSVPLSNGRYKGEAGGLEEVNLNEIVCLERASAFEEHAMIIAEWTSCGGSCNSSGIVQVFELQGGHPVVTQQIDFDSHAKGTGAKFDKDSLTLTITGRSDDESPHCCPKSLDLVTYRWEGQQFEQRSYKRVPAPVP